jgi:lipoate-protein ligase A
MKYIDLTLPTPAENLACDEALLDLCEEGIDGELLRFWESPAPFVVVGYANQVAREVDLDACKTHKIDVFRRCSGGGTVLQIPGCLNYCVILQISESSPLQSISGTNKHVLGCHQAALESLARSPIQIRGHTDLAIRDLKFSGNSQRRKRKCLLFHGTFLLQADISLIEKVLFPPSKQPDYRQGRPHRQFLINLEIDSEMAKSALRKAWNAQVPLAEPPMEQIQELVRQKYSRDDWNFKF